MSLAEQLDTAEARVGGRRSKVEVLLETLEGEDRDALLRALHDPERVPAPELARVLGKNGHHLSFSAIKRWRQDRRIQ